MGSPTAGRQHCILGHSLSPGAMQTLDSLNCFHIAKWEKARCRAECFVPAMTTRLKRFHAIVVVVLYLLSTLQSILPPASVPLQSQMEQDLEHNSLGGLSRNSSKSRLVRLFRASLSAFARSAYCARRCCCQDTQHHWLTQLPMWQWCGGQLQTQWKEYFAA